jgi:hypothetical protein
VQWGASPELGACNTRAPSDDTGARDVVRFVRGLAIALGVSLLVWAVLGALGFAIYLLVA